MKYIKKFNKHTQYQEYINNSNPKPNLPNLSFCELEDDLHLNYWSDPRIIAKFNVTSTSEATTICYSDSTSDFTEIEIDGVVQPSVVSSYTFDTTGEHTVKYTLANPTTMGNYVFYNCKSLTSITIPNSVTTIGESVFHGCTDLVSVTIPDSVTTIGQETFEACSSLTSINLPKGITTISPFIFNTCVNLTNIIIPDSVTSIGNNAFQGTGLTSITIPDNVTTIGNYAFNSCKGITTVIIPDNVTSIGNYAFNICDNLTSVNIGSGVTNIGEAAFTSNPNLITITVNNNNTIYDSRNNCNGIIKTSTNTLIAACKTTVIPDSVIEIGGNVFYGCTDLVSLTIPNSVTTIGDWNFYKCNNLTNIISLATTAPTIQSYTFYNIKTDGTLTVPAGSTGYDVWMGTGNYYLGKYNWTKVEQ